MTLNAGRARPYRTARGFIIGISLGAGLVSPARAQPAAWDQAHALYAQMRQEQEINATTALADGKRAQALADGLPASAATTGFKLALWQDLGLLALRVGDYGLAADLARRGTDLARQAQAAHDKRVFQYLTASTLRLDGDRPRAAELARGVLADARLHNDLGVAVDLLGVLGKCASDQGDFVTGLVDLHEAVALASQIGDAERQARADVLIATFYLQTRDYDQAWSYDENGMAIARRLQKWTLLGSALIDGAIIQQYRHRPDDQMQLLYQAESLATSIGSDYALMVADINLIDALNARHAYAQALDKADICLPLTRRAQNRLGEASVLVARGIALNHLGRHDEGLASIEQGLQYFIDIKSPADITEISGTLAGEYALAQNYTKALEYEKKFQALTRQTYYDEKGRALQELEQKYAADKRQDDIRALRIARQRRLIRNIFNVVCDGLGIALLAALWARYRSLQRSRGQLITAGHQLKDLALTDPLTGLHNRRFFFQNISRYTAAPATDRTDRKESKLAFYIIDLDHFKAVNDMYGHQAGDMVLRQTVARLRQVIRQSDELIRWGGEEFLLVAQHSDPHIAPMVAERLRLAVSSAPFDLGEDREISRSCSIGFAFYPLLPGMPGRPDWEAVVGLADQALYHAKTTGRDRWVGVCASSQARADTLEESMTLGLPELVRQGLCELCSGLSAA